MFSSLHLQCYFVRCCHMGLFQLFGSGLPKGRCCGFLTVLQRCQAGAWSLALGPRCFFPERGLFSLDNFVLWQKSILPLLWWWSWRRGSHRGCNSSVGFLAFSGWLCQTPCSGEAAFPMSQPQGLSETRRSEEDHQGQRPQVTSRAPSPASLLFLAKVPHQCPVPTGSSLRTKIMKTAPSKSSQEGPAASKRAVLTECSEFHQRTGETWQKLLCSLVKPQHPMLHSTPHNAALVPSPWGEPGRRAQTLDVGG